MLKSSGTNHVLGTLLLVACVGCSQAGDHEAAQSPPQQTVTPATEPPAEKSNTERQPQAAVPAQPGHPGVPMMPARTASETARPIIPMTPAVRTTPTPGEAEAGDKISLLQPGAMAPDFSYLNPAGQEVRLSHLRGKIVVLDFWATWCGPCLASFPHAQDVAAETSDQGLVLLAICTSDTRSNFETFVKNNQERYPNIVFGCDPHERESDSFAQRASRSLFGVSGLPTQFVLDRSGTIIAVIEGYDKAEHRLEESLRKLGIDIEP